MTKKQSKVAPVAVNAFASVVATVSASLVTTLSAWAAAAIGGKATRGNLSAQLLADCVTLRNNAPTVADFASAVVEVFGNGLKHTQKGVTRGSVYDALKAAGVDEQTCKTRLSNLRKIAARMGDDTFFTKATADDATFQSLYDAVKTTKAKPAKADKATSATPESTGLGDVTLSAGLSDDTIEQVITKIGIARLCAVAGKMLRVDKATDIEGLSLEAIGRKFSVK